MFSDKRMCDKCKAKPAGVHVYSNVNGEKTDLYLCEQCAEDMNIKQELNFNLLNPTDFLGSFFGLPSAFNAEPDAVCPKCGTRFSDFSRTGYLGCAECYDKFRDNLAPVIRRMHGKAQHVGKVPKNFDEKVSRQRAYDQLNEELKRAIESERYEDAAKIRDRIKKLGGAQ